MNNRQQIFLKIQLENNRKFIEPFMTIEKAFEIIKNHKLPKVAYISYVCKNKEQTAITKLVEGFIRQSINNRKIEIAPSVFMSYGAAILIKEKSEIFQFIHLPKENREEEVKNRR